MKNNLKTLKKYLFYTDISEVNPEPLDDGSER